MDFNRLFTMQGMMFLLMLLGLYLKKKGMINEDNRSLMSDLVVNVTLPCSIVRSFEVEFTSEILKSCMTIIIVALLIQVGAWVLSLILYPGLDARHKKVLQYATICSNAGILGNPIAEGIFGAMGLLYASVYLIPQRVFMWSVGMTYFTECPDRKTLIKRVLTHPCIIAVAVGMVLMVTGLRLPGVLDQTLSTMAGANTGISMLFIGSVLAGVQFKTLWNKLSMYYAFVRLFLIPLIVWGCCQAAGLDFLVKGVSVVLAGMPAASVTAILASKYHCDEVFAAKCVVSSTLLSMVTIPLWCIFLS